MRVLYLDRNLLRICLTQGNTWRWSDCNIRILQPFSRWENRSIDRRFNVRRTRSRLQKSHLGIFEALRKRSSCGGGCDQLRIVMQYVATYTNMWERETSKDGLTADECKPVGNGNGLLEWVQLSVRSLIECNFIYSCRVESRSDQLIDYSWKRLSFDMKNAAVSLHVDLYFQEHQASW